VGRAGPRSQHAARAIAGRGGEACSPIRAVGYDGVAGSAKTAENWRSEDFTGIKAKIGYPSVQEDVAVVRAMRKAAGDGMAIMVDYNQCLSPVEAVERLRVLDDEGLTWVGRTHACPRLCRARARRA